MFTGIVEEIGKIRSQKRTGSGMEIEIEALKVFEDLKIGDSILIDGACQTITFLKKESKYFSVFASEETIKRTTFDGFKAGRHVNLERAVNINTRIGGHIVSGHVDDVGRIRARRSRGQSEIFVIEIPDNLSRYLVDKGSIAIDGVSLTIVEPKGNMLNIHLIPHSLNETTFGKRLVNDRVNIEIDIYAKYIFKHLEESQKSKKSQYPGILD
jgi:riboflavin synthase